MKRKWRYLREALLTACRTNRGVLFFLSLSLNVVRGEGDKKTWRPVGATSCVYDEKKFPSSVRNRIGEERKKRGGERQGETLSDNADFTT